jgi:sugar phosphate permease
MSDDGASAGPLPAPAPGQPIDHWLALQRRGSSVLIAGLFHSMHNAIVNSTGLVAVFGLPQFEALVIMDGIVVLAAAIIAVATRGRLGLKRPESDADLNSGC